MLKFKNKSPECTNDSYNLQNLISKQKWILYSRKKLTEVTQNLIVKMRNEMWLLDGHRKVPFKMLGGGVT